MSRLTVSNIPNLNLIVIKQYEGKDFFIATPDSIVISVQSLSFILKFIIENNIMSPRVIEGILEEYYTDKGK
jgi:hypothetical protein